MSAARGIHPMGYITIGGGEDGGQAPKVMLPMQRSETTMGLVPRRRFFMRSFPANGGYALRGFIIPPTSRVVTLAGR